MVHHQINGNPDHHYAVGPNAGKTGILVQIQDFDQARVTLNVEEAEHMILLLKAAVAAVIKGPNNP